MNLRTLHFSFGPVQGFVSQSRRTRDLWASSFLLSYLSGRAMRSLELACHDPAGDHTIIFPAVKNDHLMRALRGGAAPGKHDLAAQIGSIPNRFKARVPEGIDGSVCVTALKEAWAEIGDAAFEEIGQPMSSKPIFARQNRDAWECLWVIGEHDQGLELRKNMRVHPMAPEEGEKCTICGERQEISGLPGGRRKPISEWWAKEIHPFLDQHELREGERLCAICLAKRLFPRISKKVLGWEVPRGFPSTSYMAAVPWIIGILERAPDGAAEYYRQAHASGVGESERATRIQGIATLLKGAERDRQCFADLDGGAFFADTIRNERAYPLIGSGQRRILLDALASLRKRVGYDPSPFYALLIMDGDGMGRLLTNHPKSQAELSRALAAFSAEVPGIVRGHNGRLIYAGGDDVFALLPVDHAVACAADCRRVYGAALRAEACFVPERNATISAAIEYAHIHTPLSVVVRDSHRLLDGIAKERTGRDAIACRVWKRGGPILTWALPWERVLAIRSDGGVDNLVDEVKRRFQDDRDDPGQFSSKFFYKVRDIFDVLEGAGKGPAVTEEDAVGLLLAEYLTTRERPWPKEWTPLQQREEAERRVRRLLALCQEQFRTVGEGRVGLEPGRIRADGALLVRFLAQKEV